GAALSTSRYFMQADEQIARGLMLEAKHLAQLLLFTATGQSGIDAELLQSSSDGMMESADPRLARLPGRARGQAECIGQLVMVEDGRAAGRAADERQAGEL